MRSLHSNDQVEQWHTSSSWIPNAIHNSYQIPWTKYIYITKYDNFFISQNELSLSSKLTELNSPYMI